MIGIVGAGAFGTALAIALAREGRSVLLWTRDAEHARLMQTLRENPRSLPGIPFENSLQISVDLAELRGVSVLLFAIPMQSLTTFLQENAKYSFDMPLIACCKGIDLTSLEGPSRVVLAHRPGAAVGVLTGPSFAKDIAQGLPTALTFAYSGENAEKLQALLSTKFLRLYRNEDIIGAELGGALKNVIAIAAGIVIGAGLGVSARAALISRGFAEMQRLAAYMGAEAETMAGLSGLGDLVLTCTSEMSRNFRFGVALGSGDTFDPRTTVEGVATSIAVSNLAEKNKIDMPITQMIALLVEGRTTLPDAISALMSRPLKEE